VAFISLATNLVQGDTNDNDDIFVHDLQARDTTRVSVSTSGAQGNYTSQHPSISADGRYVAFQSWANNLVDGDTNGLFDVFVHDRQTGVTSRVSVATGGGQANSNSSHPSISADGRYVAFDSTATNLVTGETNGWTKIFVHDRQTGQTSRVSVAMGGAQANYHSYQPSISADGSYVVFYSRATNLVDGDTNGVWDVFVYDRQTGETSRVSIDSEGNQGNNDSEWPSISADGRYVAFLSIASNLVLNDTNGKKDIFIHDRHTGQTTWLSVTNGIQGSIVSKPPISADGRYVTFHSPTANLVLGDTNGSNDIFVYDRQAGQVSRVSIAYDGAQSNSDSYYASISGDGRYVVFQSYASNLVSGDTNNVGDVFVLDRGEMPPTYAISGQVRDGGGAPISAVTVMAIAKFPLPIATYSTTSDSDGVFAFATLTPGAYTILLDKIGYTFSPDIPEVVSPAASLLSFTGAAIPAPECTSQTSKLNRCLVKAGDILVETGNTLEDWAFLRSIGGTYWTHAALYLGNGRIAQAAYWLPSEPAIEVRQEPIQNTGWWTGGVDWAVVRPSGVSDAAIASAVGYAFRKANADGQTVAGQIDESVRFGIMPNEPDAVDRNNERQFYCSKLVWKAYMQAGVNVEYIAPWGEQSRVNVPIMQLYVTPDAVYYGKPVIQQKKDVWLPYRLVQLFFRIYSPGHLLLIDSQGRRTGFDQATGAFLQQIPGTIYSGPDALIETIWMPEEYVSTYLLVSGFASGDYHLQTSQVDSAQPKDFMVQGSTQPSQIDRFFVTDPVSVPPGQPLVSPDPLPPRNVYPTPPAAPADPARSTVVVSPTSVLADGTATATITVTLRTAADAPAAGKQVLLATSRGPVDMVAAATGNTDANGVYTTTIRSRSPGTTSIKAYVAPDGVYLPEASLTFTR
jgi:Tol biopolymer transport system component